MIPLFRMDDSQFGGCKYEFVISISNPLCWPGMMPVFLFKLVNCNRLQYFCSCFCANRSQNLSSTLIKSNEVKELEYLMSKNIRVKRRNVLVYNSCPRELHLPAIRRITRCQTTWLYATKRIKIRLVTFTLLILVRYYFW